MIILYTYMIIIKFNIWLSGDKWPHLKTDLEPCNHEMSKNICHIKLEDNVINEKNSHLLSLSNDYQKINKLGFLQ